MAQIKLTPDELRTSATKYQQGSQTINDLLTTLKSEQETIRGNWSGNSFDKFDDQFNSLTPKVTEFATLLEDIFNQLNKVAEIIEQTDQDIASQIGTV
ncbi:WXG100 family type VII secretion target [Weissella confusa]|uniref:WXG100 family type VII secretion target n=1 Tax=Weissella confusa TaxID=1583 RepID=UPI001C6FC3D3|nr:WXG100 family type VII secretion target [Weissella confusa]QYU58609.1 WXG100 family type VII secretion target [Weissella confusa]